MHSVDTRFKGRERLFTTLDQTRSHFLAAESSGSGSSEEGNDEDRASLSESGETEVPRGEVSERKASSSIIAADGDLVEGGEGGDNMSIRYSRVATDERASSPKSEDEQSKRRRSHLAERISNKLHALLWVVIGSTVAVQTDFVRVLLEDKRVNRVWFNVGVACFSINMVILAYLTVWLPYVRGIKISWNVYCPRAIPTATVVGLICAVTLNVSLWNVWGFLTPLILFAVFSGCLFGLHFVPWPC